MTLLAIAGSTIGAWWRRAILSLDATGAALEERRPA